MSINWFEGGRRLNKLVMAVAALIGAYVLFSGYRQPDLVFYTASPLDEWHFRIPAEPPEPADACEPSETLWAYEIKPNEFRDIYLCFDPGGKSDAEIADAMAAQAAFNIMAAREEGYADAQIIDYLRLRLTRSFLVIFDDNTYHIYADAPDNISEEFVKDRAIRDRPGTSVIEVELFKKPIEFLFNKESISDNEDSMHITLQDSDWWQNAISDFEISPEMLASVDQNLPQIDRRAMIEHVTSVLGTTAAFIASFWVLSFLIGWIVRGFAGIPKGQDFRSIVAEGEKANVAP